MTGIRTWRSVLAALLALGAVAAVASACSSDEDADGANANASTSTASTTAPSTTAPPPAAAPSPGTGGVTVTPDAVPIAGPAGTATVTVAWEGQEPRTLMFISVCRKPTGDPTFDVAADCSSLSELTPNGTPDGRGTVELEVFRGPTPDGDGIWGCFADADEAPAGVQKNTTCYVRVTNDVVLNDDDARDAPFTIVDG